MDISTLLNTNAIIRRRWSKNCLHLDVRLIRTRIRESISTTRISTRPITGENTIQMLILGFGKYLDMCLSSLEFGKGKAFTARFVFASGVAETGLTS